MDKQSQIKENQRERFEMMVVRLANLLELSSVDKFELLPPLVRDAFKSFKYLDVVLPLIHHDREVNTMSYRQLEIKYGIPKSTIQNYLNGSRYK